MTFVPRLKWTLPLFAGTAALLALLHAGLATPVYEVGGTILVKRTSLDYPGGAGEEAKNRWVWVRDGLALKAELTSDARLRDIVATIPALAARRTAFVDAYLKKHAHVAPADATEIELIYAQELRRALAISYTGGDENIFEVRARDNDPTVARALTAALLSEIGDMTRDQGAAAAKLAQVALLEKAKKAREDGLSQGDFVEDSRPLLAEYYDHFVAKAELAAATDKDRVSILSHPVAAVRVWPKPLFAALAAAAFGMLLALALDLFQPNGVRRLLKSATP